MKRGIWGGIFLMTTFLVGIGLAHAQSKPWNKIFSGRYQALATFTNAAVLDRETGLIWEACPSSDARDWSNAILHCANRFVDGRKGWRVPSIEELTSLINSPPGDFPGGSPFCDTNAFLGASFLWSTTTYGQLESDALGVAFANIAVGTFVKSSSGHVWCVRGGTGPGTLVFP